MIEYTLTRSKRRTIAIYIRADASVEVRAPLRTPKRELDSLVTAKAEWIAENVEKRRRLLEERAKFALYYGATVPLLGSEYTLIEHRGRTARFDGERFLLPSNLAPEEIRSAVTALYKKLAKEILREKTARFSALMGVSPRSVRIGSAKTRWGSCSGKNAVCFSWRLIMAEEQTVDYVVVHELAHILEHNHSKRFWTRVESVFPDYSERRKRLKSLQERLSRENWD